MYLWSVSIILSNPVVKPLLFLNTEKYYSEECGVVLTFCEICKPLFKKGVPY